MQLVRRTLDSVGERLERGPLARLKPLYDAVDTFFYTPGAVSRGHVHVRDALDLKRMMVTVVIALVPAMVVAIYNTGYQAHAAIAAGAAPLDGWQEWVYGLFGLGYSPADVLACFVHGAVYYLPIYAVTFAVGIGWEILFAVVRRHEVSEGFFVTSALVPLIVPATLPLWQLALATSFGVVLGKEIFGGVGMNFLNPALVIRAFLFFAYPGEISGEKVWVAAKLTGVDGYSGATYLARAAELGPAGLHGIDWWDAFMGFMPGSMGETSALALLAGGLLVVVTRVASLRTILGVTIGTLLMASLLNAIGSDTNPMFAVPFHWHLVLGGWMLGTLFMATDPVSSPFCNSAKWVYGFLIGALTVLVRVVNPAYPEGMMLAILFMNMFAPLIDHFFVQANVKRREARCAVQ